MQCFCFPDRVRDDYEMFTRDTTAMLRNFRAFIASMRDATTDVQSESLLLINALVRLGGLCVCVRGW